ncbi:MAG: glycosyltransferase [Planktotalea sp.]|uniref:glycosyltransferase family 2 protein n=1 Tax=Planktotalea sp. TaxID=2029877 RepID=UPI002609F517|nr:glycosyltransferase [Planktotalea sp.]MDG1085615.1 glycosyltransferase [Planktotalea sp.]
MSTPTVSVIVVSRGRAADLPLCLLGISQLDYPNFEVVLVADSDGLSAVRELLFFDDLKVIEFNEANISAARNLGIAEAAGEVVAFIDDDAVPEPTWLNYLTAGFRDPDVAAAGGFVIGRNGISFQWKARSVDVFGEAAALEVAEDQISVLTPSNGCAIKTEGTNMALRRDVIAQMGGFDPAFRFYLDETDVNFRLMYAGYRTAIAPLAQVHHGYRASATRRSDRVPTDLFEIGASLAVYLRKHASGNFETLVRARHDQRRRVLRHMVNGLVEPRDVRRLLASFDKGVAVGKSREILVIRAIPNAATGFQPMERRPSSDHAVLAGKRSELRRVLSDAETIVKEGGRASAFIFSTSARAHKVRFTNGGVWVQSGGLFGRSIRSGPRYLLNKRRKRISKEVKRLAMVRGFPTKSTWG